MSESSAEDKTEAPSAKRLEHAREEGNVPVSRDVTVLSVLVGSTFGAIALLPGAIENLAANLSGFISSVGRMDIHDVAGDGSVMRLLVAALRVICSIGIPAAIAAITSVLLQSSFYIGGAPIQFKFSRISPSSGFSRIFSAQNFVEFLKACGKLGLLATIVWSILGHNPLQDVVTIDWDIAAILPEAGIRVGTIVKPLLMALAALAAFDILLVRGRYTKQLRMTREEMRREMREGDGDPFMKAKLRRIREQRAKRRMMHAVKTAEVIITNPTHYAVALSYDRKNNGAPRIVAKGVDHMAMRIREEAGNHNIPIIPNPPLARALYQVELDHEIPAEHYQAVAEVIAFVWKIRNRVAAPVS
jgi:flagellar biosynthetic protein FlhB